MCISVYQHVCLSIPACVSQYTSMCVSVYQLYLSYTNMYISIYTSVYQHVYLSIPACVTQYTHNLCNIPHCPLVALLKAAFICAKIVEFPSTQTLKEQLETKYGCGFQLESTSRVPQGSGTPYESGFLLCNIKSLC